MSDTTGAMVEGPYTYDPYGNCTSGGSTCSSSGEPYRFTGRRWDPEIGCYYYRARYYCPDDMRGGRFLQTDPVGYDTDLDLYTYVGNDPVNNADPTGETATLICVTEPGQAQVCIYTNRDDSSRYRASLSNALNQLGRLISIIVKPTAVGVFLAVMSPTNAGKDCSINADQIECKGQSPGTSHAERTPPSQDQNDRRREAKPKDAPTGTKPINRSGLGKGKIHDIKDGIGAGPKDWVGIAPNGDIITTNPETGEAVNEGNVSDYN